MIKTQNQILKIFKKYISQYTNDDNEIFLPLKRASCYYDKKRKVFDFKKHIDDEYYEFLFSIHSIEDLYNIVEIIYRNEKLNGEYHPHETFYKYLKHMTKVKKIRQQ